MSRIARAVPTFLIGAVIFVGLPLVGWGVTDMRGFFAEPARLIYAVVTVLLQLIIIVWLPEAGRTRSQAQKTVPRQRLSLFLLQVIPMAILLVGPYCDRRSIAVIGWDAWRYVGLLLFAFGFIAMHGAEAALGRQFSVQVTIQEEHRLVTTGPYRYLRHPRYLCIIFFTLGIALIFRSWLALLLVAMLTVALLWRIHDEEALLHEAFGAEWEAYARRTARLIPPIY